MHVHALWNRETQLARHQWHRLDDIDVVLIEPPFVRDLDDIAESLGRQQCGLGTLALDDGVGRERRAVNEHGDIAEGEPGTRQDFAHALNDRLLGGTRRGQQLADQPPLAGEQNDIRKVPPISTASRAPAEF